MSKLSQLASSLPVVRRVGEGDPEVRRIVYDSRLAREGDLFAALPGLKTDGTRFVADAVARGASAVLLEEDRARDLLPLPVPALLAPSARAALGWAAAALYGYPSRAMTLIGVTGTNGKTTTTHLIEAIFREAGETTGVIGTLGARIGDRTLPGDRTTPEAPDLQALFAAMRDEGVTAAAMEVSSHALVQDRALGAEFDAAVFTNLTQDHLDYHDTLDAYFDAKAILFRDYPRHTSKPFTAVINVDDPWGRRLAAELREAEWVRPPRAGADRSAPLPGARGKWPLRVVTYGMENPEADLRATKIGASPAGISFDLWLPPRYARALGSANERKRGRVPARSAGGARRALGEGDRSTTRSAAPSAQRRARGALAVSLQLGGHFNVMNALAAAGVGWSLGVAGEIIAAALAKVPGVPGRFEAVRAGQPFSVIVDYAHTPDGLLNVLNAARALRPKRLLVVLGCGGDRDRTKRPRMGQLAARLADVAFVTSDNPRSEDPEAIIGDILAGIDALPTAGSGADRSAPARAGALPSAGRTQSAGQRARVVVEPDRRAAIHAACAEAGPGDLVLIAGKGHEDYQIFADRTIHFDDREVAREFLEGRLSPTDA